jgi:hypothetical protein
MDMEASVHNTLSFQKSGARGKVILEYLILNYWKR